MKNVKIIDHPLLQHKLTFLRDKNTGPAEFRNIVKETSRILAYEATRDLNTVKKSIETPLCKTDSPVISNSPILVSIMRAGNGMLDALLSLMPFAQAGHIGIYRDKFIKNTVEYYFRLPNEAKGKEVLLLDPMLATGDTVVACLDRLKQYDVGKIKLISILASKEGLEKVCHFHPDIEIFVAQVENELNEKGYLLPGMGDAGDRIYFTKQEVMA